MVIVNHLWKKWMPNPSNEQPRQLGLWPRLSRVSNGRLRNWDRTMWKSRSSEGVDWWGEIIRRALKVQHKFASSFWWSCELHVFEYYSLKILNRSSYRAAVHHVLSLSWLYVSKSTMHISTGIIRHYNKVVSLVSRWPTAMSTKADWWMVECTIKVITCK